MDYETQIVSYMSENDTSGYSVIEIFNTVSRKNGWRNIPIKRRDAILTMIRNLKAAPLLAAAMGKTILNKEE